MVGQGKSVPLLTSLQKTATYGIRPLIERNPRAFQRESLEKKQKGGKKPDSQLHAQCPNPIYPISAYIPSESQKQDEKKNRHLRPLEFVIMIGR